MSKAGAKAIVSRIRAICLELPESEERPFGGHTSPAFRVRDKMFVVISEDQTSMTFKAPEGVQAILINDDPERFFVPKYVGSKGWVGARLDLPSAPDWEEMAEIIYESYCLIAPSRLVRQWEDRR
jgi:predicted DNA-binding protein (MmcQ/YjbR family)